KVILATRQLAVVNHQSSRFVDHRQPLVFVQQRQRLEYDSRFRGFHYIAHRRNQAEANASTPTPPVIHDHSGTEASCGPPACRPYSSADTTTRPTPVTAVITRRCMRLSVSLRLTMSCERIANSCLPSTCCRNQLCSSAGMSGALVMISGRRLPSSFSARRGL